MAPHANFWLPAQSAPIAVTSAPDANSINTMLLSGTSIVIVSSRQVRSGISLLANAVTRVTGPSTLVASCNE